MSEILSRDIGPIGTPVDRVRSKGKRYALVIGIDAYHKKLGKLNNAVKDAVVMAKKLKKDFGFEVTSLVNDQAHKSAILERIDRWRVESKLEDSLLLFFAGHGKNLPDEHRGLKGFLIPADANENSDTWISESDIVQAAREMPASYVLLIFDACYAGTTFRDDILPGARDDQVLKALVAGTEKEPVLDGGAGDHSIFTRAVLDGLEGFADSGQRPDDVITADELITYVRSEVRWRSHLRGRSQSAVGGSLQGCQTGEDFQFIPIKPRLKAPILRNLYSPEFQDRISAAEQLGMSSNDSAEVRRLKAVELQRLLTGDRNREVRKMAAKSLGTLELPDGIAALVEELNSGVDREVQGSAAISLGVLTRSILDSNETESKDEVDLAVQSLINALKHDEAATRQAAKEGLSYLPESTDQIGVILEGHNREHQVDALDALAFVGDRHPELDAAWPPLDRINHRLRRRVYLTRLRMKRLWPGILRPILGVGLGGAIGLSLAYFLVVLVAFESIQLFGPAILTFSILPGAFAGAGLALMPRLVRGIYRKPGKPATVVAALLGGLFLTLGMILPNWFLGVGEEFAAWLLPGLLIGPSIGLALSLLPLDPLKVERTVRVEKRWRKFFSRIRPYSLQILAIALVGFLTLAVTRIPEETSLNALDNQLFEALFWGLGGAILAGSLAISWLAWPLSALGSFLSSERG